MLLVLVAVLAVIAGLLVRRDRLTDQRLAVERRQLSIAVNNIPQGLVLYDASARIIICNQPYLDMFGLSPDVARPGCTMPLRRVLRALFKRHSKRLLRSQHQLNLSVI